MWAADAGRHSDAMRHIRILHAATPTVIRMGMKLRGKAPALLGAMVVSVGMIAAGAPAYASGGVEIFNRGSGKCLATLSGSDLVFQEVCDGTLGQRWDLLGTPGSIRFLRNYATNKCTHADGNFNFAEIHMIDCADPPQDGGSLWLINVVPPAIPPGQIVMFQVFNARCLDLENGSPQSGVVMQIWTCNSSTNNQKWDVYPE